MKSIRKMFITALCGLMISNTSNAVSAETICETVTNDTVARGIVHTCINRMTDGGWQKINIITADLSDEAVSVHAIYDSRGISYRNTLSQLLTESGVDAAINADFFDMTISSGRTTPLGLTAENGTILSSPAHDTALAAIAQTEDGIFTDYFQMDLRLVAENGNEMPILHINKFHPTDSIVMFTRDWGEYTEKVSDGSCDMVIEDGKVKDMILNSEGTKIPENGCVLRVNTNINNFFAENFEIGDKAEIVLDIIPECEPETAVGGGTVLVKDGKVATFTNNVTGYNPRSAAGVSRDNTKLYLVTVEGREKNTRGMTQQELAEFMIEIGAYNAINFDGGGSTEMAIKNEEGKTEIVNTPSEGTERRISTGLGVLSDGDDKHFASMKLSASQENVFMGDYVEIWCRPLDNYGKTAYIDQKLEYSSEDGRFDGNKFYPEKAGINTVYVTAGDVTESIDINVLGEVSNLVFYPGVFSGESAHLSLVAMDSEGNKSQINPESVVFTVTDGNGVIDSLGNITCDGSGATVTATFGSKTAYCNGNKPDEIIPRIKDYLLSSENNASFIVLPKKAKQDKMINCITNSFLEKHAKEYKGKVFSFGAYDNNTKDISGFWDSYTDNCAFVTIDNNSTIYKSGGAQWKKLAVLKGASQKNIIVFLTNDLTFNDAGEKELFDKLMSDYIDAGKRMFVVFGSDTNSIDIENGVRYISIKNGPELKLANFDNTVSDAEYLKFFVNGDTLTYGFAKIIDPGR
ncbi:MAG: phosphodiester glycosidase family protein [Clostridia bacterium]|nr:phosphodiester glycosidase family protein [Clostridia bacterium]